MTAAEERAQLSLGILTLRKGHKQDGCCPLRARSVRTNNASSNAVARHAHVLGQEEECLVASCSEECSPSAERSLQGFTTCFPKEVTGGCMCIMAVLVI